MVTNMDEATFCYRCHKEMGEDVAFCESCGNFVCTSCLAERSRKEYDSGYPVGICQDCHRSEARESKMMRCPRCGVVIKQYRSPFTTVDLIIKSRAENDEEGIALILRDREPRMWALPGGFCEYGERLEDAAVREAKEETGLDAELIEQFYTYSDPRRDPRHHSITTVFIAKSMGEPVAGDDAREVRVFTRLEIPEVLAFDHQKILDDYFFYEQTGSRPKPLWDPALSNAF